MSEPYYTLKPVANETGETLYHVHAFIEAANGNALCGLWMPWGNAERKQVGEFLTRAVNAHDDLVTTLKRISELSKPGQVIGISQAIDLVCDIHIASEFALKLAGELPQ